MLLAMGSSEKRPRATQRSQHAKPSGFFLENLIKGKKIPTKQGPRSAPSYRWPFADRFSISWYLNEGKPNYTRCSKRFLDVPNEEKGRVPESGQTRQKSNQEEVREPRWSASLLEWKEKFKLVLYCCSIRRILVELRIRDQDQRRSAQGQDPETKANKNTRKEKDIFANTVKRYSPSKQRKGTLKTPAHIDQGEHTAVLNSTTRLPNLRKTPVIASRLAPFLATN